MSFIRDWRMYAGFFFCFVLISVRYILKYIHFKYFGKESNNYLYVPNNMCEGLYTYMMIYLSMKKIVPMNLNSFSNKAKSIDYLQY